MKIKERARPEKAPVENAEIARRFDEVADCLELEGANEFRVRAYWNAARVMRELPRPAARLARDGDGGLEGLPGIGKDLAGKIRTIVETGELPHHRELCRRVPAGLRAMMGVPGLGPKRAMILNKKLGIASPAQLKAAAAAGRIRALKGFGARTETAVLVGLADLEGSPRRILLSEAKPYAEALVAHLKGAPGATAVEAAGSYRRRRETVGDLDILAATARPRLVMERLASYDGVARVLARGGTKMTVRLKNGLQVDLRAVPAESFGAALQYFTGSKAHSIELRARAQTRKLKLSEYGVFHGARRVAGRDEADVYAALGLPLIPPELREGRGEVERALAGGLPSLVELGDIKGDLHMHTTVTDGRDGLEEMVEAAKARGYEYVAITEHSKRVTMARGLDAAGLRRHWRRIEKLAARTSGLAVLKGVEVDILDDGALDLPDDVLREADWVLASLHYGQRQPRERITRRLLAAIKNPVVSAIGHPTGRIIGKRPPYDADMEEVLKAAADHGCALELDGQPDRLDLNDVDAAAAKAKGIPIVVDSDAHSVHELGNMENGVFQARRAGLTAADVANTRPWAGLRRLIRRRAG
ncbi:MAG: DNA polymerase/3'-5' exonuclease PolX [Elusimicrobia bacterium]|nr:DNA polymerase/3'-5' exonuclease PolX [Elusimicrobiota bacterium]